MNKYIGYGIAVVGLIIAILSFNLAGIPALASIPKYYVMIAGIIVIGVGVALSMTNSSSPVKQATEEVPIYAGVGKNRKIVGYRKD